MEGVERIRSIHLHSIKLLLLRNYLVDIRRQEGVSLAYLRADRALD